jgi:hypothetical protein
MARPVSKVTDFGEKTGIGYSAAVEFLFAIVLRRAMEVTQSLMVYY